jgi:hypothetical protein
MRQMRTYDRPSGSRLSSRSDGASQQLSDAISTRSPQRERNTGEHDEESVADRAVRTRERPGRAVVRGQSNHHISWQCFP